MSLQRVDQASFPPDMCRNTKNWHGVARGYSIVAINPLIQIRTCARDGGYTNYAANPCHPVPLAPTSPLSVPYKGILFEAEALVQYPVILNPPPSAQIPPSLWVVSHLPLTH